MTIKLGVVMDPIESIHVYKDSTLAMLLSAQARGGNFITWNRMIFSCGMAVAMLK